MSAWFVAIDFGSRETCMGFSGVDEPGRVRALSNCSSPLSNKVPSSILLNPDQEFDAFGFDAEERYRGRTDRERDRWWLLRGFIQLFNMEGLDKDVTVRDTQGREVSARKVFAMAIRHMVKLCSRQMDSVLGHNWTVSMCKFVLTIPTSWNSTAIQCVKAAAAEAGLTVDNVMFVLDTEAASLMCQDIIERKVVGTCHSYDEESKALAINWGHGRMDFAVLEMRFDQTMRVTFLHGKTVNGTDAVLQGCFDCLAEICGDATADQIKNAMDNDCLQNIRTKTRKIDFNSKSQRIDLPVDVLRKCKQNTSHSKILIQSEQIRKWFSKPLSEGIECIENELKEISDVILYGDFAENKLVVDTVRSALNVRVIVPEDLEMAVLTGAVAYGHSPEIVTSRITRSRKPEIEIEKEQPSLVVAAIDFGTTYSGYAYAFSDKKGNVYTNKGWESGGQPTQKTPTSILLNSKMEFDSISFGYEAEYKYANLCEGQQRHGWMLFRRFKMLLHMQENLDRNVLVKDIKGKTMPALTIFTMAIRYLRIHLLENLRNRVDETDILYVLTVPAIWNDAAKQFMREAAVAAGIDERRLRLALEPEAAAVWCQSEHTDMASSDIQYMVVDIGGGTTDISVIAKSNKLLRELHRPTGGAWGGTNVDKNYLSWMSEVLGENTMARVQKNHIGCYFALQQEFEMKKRVIKPNATDWITIKPDGELWETYEKESGGDFKDLPQVKYTYGKLRIEPSIVQSWFAETIERIVDHVEGLLQMEELKKVRTVMLVGGFADCKLLQDKFRQSIQGRQLIIPEEAVVAVMKGAVLFGLKPSSVSSRIMNYTYGISKTVPYDRRIHSNANPRYDNQRDLVVDIFVRFVAVGSEVHVGDVFSTGFEPTEPRETKINIYSSTEPDPKYVTGKPLGEVTVIHADGDSMKDKIFEVSFEFGKTEIVVKTRRHKTGDVKYTRIDCL